MDKSIRQEKAHSDGAKTEGVASISDYLENLNGRLVSSWLMGLQKLKNFNLPLMRKVTFRAGSSDRGQVSLARTFLALVQRYTLQFAIYAVIIVSICSFTFAGGKHLFGMLEDQMTAMGVKVAQSASLQAPNSAPLKIASVKADQD